MTSDHFPYDQHLLQQWAFFRTGRPVDHSIVRGIIYDSWRRCREAEQDPEHLKLEKLSPSEFNQILERDRLLVTVAQSVLKELDAAGNFGRLHLCSREGVGLCTVYAQEEGERPRFLHGGGLGEKSILDGAASMCLRLRQEVEICGPEHWHVALHNFHCVASPIFDWRQHMVGVLSIYTERSEFHPSVKVLMRLAVRQITAQLALHEHDALQAALVEQVEDGLVLLNGDGTILDLNAMAREWLGLSTRAGDENIADFISRPPSCLDDIRQRRAFQRREIVLTRQRRAGWERRFSSTFQPTGESGGLLRLHHCRSVAEHAGGAVGVPAAYTFSHIAGTSVQRQQIVEKARRMAGTDAPVLLLGESGTGKELFAQAIHNASLRSHNPFVVVNCGALPRDLVQAELFGYVEGAFTGARKKGNAGKFELADGGTLFLDEIGDMPLEAQASLLRLAQNGEVTRIGASRATRVNVRILAATNRNLSALMAAGAFREDLYFRLSALTLTLPPLRERKEDIRLLAERFLYEICSRYPLEIRSFSEDALAKLERYPWPGNIRQLRNVVEQACCMATGAVIKVTDLSLPPAVPSPTPEPPIKEGNPAPAPVQETPNAPGNPGTEQNILEEALQRTGGNVKKAAALLHISRYTLYNKLKACGLNPAHFRGLKIHAD